MRHKYLRLEVWDLKIKKYRLDQMREAVEYLKTIPDTGFTGLVAIAATITHEAGFKLGAKPRLSLSQIIGKTPKEVWELFDKEVDSQIEGLAKRMTGKFGNP